MDGLVKSSLPYFFKSSLAIDLLILRTLDQLHPEITAKQLRLELELAHVCPAHLCPEIKTAVQGMLVSFVGDAPCRSEIAITLSNSHETSNPGFWELEICQTSFAERQDFGMLEPNFTNGKLDRHHLTSAELPLQDNLLNSLLMAVTAAEHCAGTLEAWHCPQGGIALILTVPKRSSKFLVA